MWWKGIEWNVIGHREPELQLTTPTLWCRPRRSWCRWVRPFLFQSICPLRCGRCWPHCQPSDSECQRSCHLWDVATTWHPNVERRRSDRKKADISSVVDLSYESYSLMTVFYVSFWMSACHQPPSQRPRNIQMSQSSGTLRSLWKCQSYSGLCDCNAAFMYISNRLQVKYRTYTKHSYVT